MEPARKMLNPIGWYHIGSPLPSNYERLYPRLPCPRFGVAQHDRRSAGACGVRRDGVVTTRSFQACLPPYLLYLQVPPNALLCAVLPERCGLCRPRFLMICAQM